MTSQAMVVLGIDPGTRIAGYAITRVEGRRVVLLSAGALELAARDSLSKRIGHFYSFFNGLIAEYKIQRIALETPFLGKYAHSFLKLGYIRGIVYLLQDMHQVELREFAPMEVKMAVTGYGRADKEQVARMVMRLFPGFIAPKRLDITDALAVALCGAWSV